MDRKYLKSLNEMIWIIQTGLAKHILPDAFQGMEFLYPTMKIIEQGAARSVWVAVRRAWEHAGGKYLSDCAVTGPYVEGDDKTPSLGYAWL